MNQEEILNFVASLDQRLVAGAAVLVLLLMLFWRVLSRTSRLEREIGRINDRLERIRDEVRNISRPSLSVAPASEAAAVTEPAEDATEPHEAPPEVPDLTDAQAEEDDVLSRAAASLAESGLEAEAVEEDDSFSFGEESIADPSEIPGAEEEPPAAFAPEAEEVAAPAEEPIASATEPAAPAAKATEQPQAAEQPAASGVERLESDPARPGVNMVRCLSCNYKLAYPEKLAGKRVRCPSCRVGLDLP